MGKILQTIVASLFVVFVLSFIIGGFIDSYFVHPVAAENANNYCKSFGFDQYKTFNRIGLFSTKPVAIKCEYAEKYTDLGVRTNA